MDSILLGCFLSFLTLDTDDTGRMKDAGGRLLWALREMVLKGECLRFGEDDGSYQVCIRVNRSANHSLLKMEKGQWNRVRVCLSCFRWRIRGCER